MQEFRGGCARQVVMALKLADLEEVLWPYFRPLWIERLGVPQDITDEELKALIHIWVDEQIHLTRDRRRTD